MNKSRNQMLALLCAAIFLMAGYGYFRAWVVQKPFGIILIVADALEPELLGIARQKDDGGSRSLKLDHLPYSAMLTAPHASDGIEDEPAYASILATGQTGRCGDLSVSPTGKPLQTLFDHAREGGRVTGLVGNVPPTHPHLAAHFASLPGPVGQNGILDHFAAGERFDVFLGVRPGSVDMEPFLDRLRNAQFDTATTMLDVLRRPEWQFPRIAALLDHVGPSTPELPPEQTATLPKLTRAAIRFLQYNRSGYFLVVHVDAPAAVLDNGDPEAVRAAVLELNGTLKVAMEYAGDNTLVVLAGNVRPGSDTPSDILSMAAGAGARGWSGTRHPEEVFKLIRSNL